MFIRSSIEFFSVFPKVFPSNAHYSRVLRFTPSRRSLPLEVGSSCPPAVNLNVFFKTQSLKLAIRSHFP